MAYACQNAMYMVASGSNILYTAVKGGTAVCMAVLYRTCPAQAGADHLVMHAGNIREKVLKKQVREHIRIVKTLAKSPMHGLKPERDELVARLCCVDDLQSETLV